MSVGAYFYLYTILLFLGESAIAFPSSAGGFHIPVGRRPDGLTMLADLTVTPHTIPTRAERARSALLGTAAPAGGATMTPQAAINATSNSSRAANVRAAHPVRIAMKPSLDSYGYGVRGHLNSATCAGRRPRQGVSPRAA